MNHMNHIRTCIHSSTYKMAITTTTSPYPTLCTTTTSASCCPNLEHRPHWSTELSSYPRMHSSQWSCPPCPSL